MTCAGWPDQPGCLYLVTECRRMPARTRPARAIAIAAAQESRRRLLVVGINCVLAAVLTGILAIAAL